MTLPIKSVARKASFLLPGWDTRLQSVSDEPRKMVRNVLPLATRSFESEVRFVDDAAAAQEMVDLVRQRPIAVAGFDSEFKYTRPSVLMKWLGEKPLEWNDPKSVAPLLLSFAFLEPVPNQADRVYRFVVDVRNACVLPSLQAVLDRPTPFCCHFAQAELVSLWRLGLREPSTVWDSWVAQKAQLLGRFHKRNKIVQDETDEARTADQMQQELLSRCDLLSVCRLHGIEHPFAGDKEALQQSFLRHDDAQRFLPRQIEYAAADATVAARIYQRQIDEAIRTNALTHLMAVEMPWAVTNARMHYDGVYLCPDRLARVKLACERNTERLRAELLGLGLENAMSPAQVKDFMESRGLLEFFRSGKGYCFDEPHLEAIEDREPAAAKILQYRRMRRLLSCKLLTGELVGADGRFHPAHRQLGADSVRNSMQWPNIGGVGKALRPVVVPQDARTMRIGEVDLSQIEVGIAAALFEEPRLIAMFNSGDVYSQMAKRYFRGELTDEDVSTPDRQFKKLHRQKRDRMKVFTLATIYNITAVGLSAQLGCSERTAQQQLDAFLALFPDLAAALQQAVAYGQIRGYSELVTGLRRHRGRSGRLIPWEVNWMRNTPVQGTAGVVFKVAGNRLYRRYQHYGAKLLLPMHDAFVFEAPVQHLRDVARITADVMVSTVQEYFRALNPQAEINIDYPGCWNKDGKYRSLDLWCVNPEHAKKYLAS